MPECPLKMRRDATQCHISHKHARTQSITKSTARCFTSRNWSTFGFIVNWIMCACVRVYARSSGRVARWFVCVWVCALIWNHRLFNSPSYSRYPLQTQHRTTNDTTSASAIRIIVRLSNAAHKFPSNIDCECVRACVCACACLCAPPWSTVNISIWYPKLSRSSRFIRRRIDFVDVFISLACAVVGSARGDCEYMHSRLPSTRTHRSVR